MDMNDILGEWDRIQSDKIRRQKESGRNTVSHKKANAPTPEEKAAASERDFERRIAAENSKQINPIEMWLRRYGTVDKDRIAGEAAEREKQYDRNYLVAMKPEARIDLHGLHQDEARERLSAFIADCRRRGIRKILVVHGKGIHTKGTDPVLGEMVRRFIESDSRCGMSGHPKTRQEGGSGATWVVLK